MRVRTFSKLAGVGVATVGLCLSTAPSSFAATPAHDTSNPANRVSQFVEVGGGFTTSLTSAQHVMSAAVPVAGREIVTNAAGAVVSSRLSTGATVRAGTQAGALAHPDATVGSYRCVINTKANSNFRAYTPEVWGQSGNSYTNRWTFNGYSVDNARFVSGRWTFQTEQCVTGGGTSWNSWHQYFNGASTTESGTQLLGQTWGTGVSNSSTSTTLNFNVSAGPVQIGASTTITPGVGSYTGSTGHDPNIVGYPYSSGLDVNRVNANFVSPHSWVWDGTGSFEGNNGQALWETSESGASVSTYNFIGMKLFCAKTGFSGCASMS
jgi:hypothetical protein